MDHACCMDGIGWVLVKDRDTSPDVIGRMDMVRVVVRLGGGIGIGIGDVYKTI